MFTTSSTYFNAVIVHTICNTSSTQARFDVTNYTIKFCSFLLRICRVKYNTEVKCNIKLMSIQTKKKYKSIFPQNYNFRLISLFTDGTELSYLFQFLKFPAVRVASVFCDWPVCNHGAK